jgi:hypothetical protein
MPENLYIVRRAEIAFADSRIELFQLIPSIFYISSAWTKTGFTRIKLSFSSLEFDRIPSSHFQYNSWTVIPSIETIPKRFTKVSDEKLIVPLHVHDRPLNVLGNRKRKELSVCKVAARFRSIKTLKLRQFLIHVICAISGPYVIPSTMEPPNDEEGSRQGLDGDSDQRIPRLKYSMSKSISVIEEST